MDAAQLTALNLDIGTLCKIKTKLRGGQKHLFDPSALDRTCGHPGILVSKLGSYGIVITATSTVGEELLGRLLENQILPLQDPKHDANADLQKMPHFLQMESSRIPDKHRRKRARIQFEADFADDQGREWRLDSTINRGYLQLFRQLHYRLTANSVAQLQSRLIDETTLVGKLYHRCLDLMDSVVLGKKSFDDDMPVTSIVAPPSVSGLFSMAANNASKKGLPRPKQWQWPATNKRGRKTSNASAWESDNWRQPQVPAPARQAREWPRVSSTLTGAWTVQKSNTKRLETSFDGGPLLSKAPPRLASNMFASFDVDTDMFANLYSNTNIFAKLESVSQEDAERISSFRANTYQLSLGHNQANPDQVVSALRTKLADMKPKIPAKLLDTVRCKLHERQTCCGCFWKVVPKQDLLKKIREDIPVELRMQIDA